MVDSYAWFYCGLIVDAEVDEAADSDDREGGVET